LEIDNKTDNRINKILEKNKEILSVYFTAGFPRLSSTIEIVKNLDKAGADMIEIGIPFSDPVADGEVIQKSSQIALKNGMNLKLLFEQLMEVRKATDIPLLAMGYLNPIYQFGFEPFCQKCEEVGIDGLIIPDLPLTEIEESYGDIMARHNLKNVMLISPNTTPERIRKIDKLTTGFIYMVSSASTTGVKKDLSDAQLNYFERIKNLNLRNPKVIGFGISDKQSFNTACKYAEGAIIGSAFIKHIEKFGDDFASIDTFIKSIRK
jgi:tryptophan synthase alpha chain